MDQDRHLLSSYHHRGDAESFGMLVRHHAGMVFATAKRVTRDAGLAEDVAQETFLELARSGHGTVDCVAAWLHRVAWRKACNTVRGESRRRRREQMAAELRNTGEDGNWSELESHVDAAMEELPAELREPLVRHYFEGRTQQEVAAQLGVSQSTVSRQLDAAVGQLRSSLRRRGVATGAGLAVVLGAGSAEAIPAALAANLGKLAVSGVGAGSAATPPVFVPSFLTTMTTFTKVLLATGVTAAVGLSIALQRKTDPARREAAPAPVSSRAEGGAQGFAPQSSQLTREAPRYRPAAVSGSVSAQVDGILKRLHSLSKVEVMHDAEIERLEERFIKVISTPEMQLQLAARITALRASGRSGSMKIDHDLLDKPHGRAWLEAVVSNDEQLMKDWVLNTLDGAIFEFSMDPSLEKTSDGIGFPAATAKSKAVAPRPAPADPEK